MVQLRISPLAVYAVGFIPAVWTFYLGIIDQLGADPMRVLEQTLGLWALRFLIITLAITPLRDLFGYNFVRYRRAFGLLCFYYTLLHLTTYVVLDQNLNIAVILNDVFKRPFITAGVLSFVVLTLLAITSNNMMIHRMGAASWIKLHRFVYLAAAAAAVHFILLVKSWPMEPLVYFAIVMTLLACRLFKRIRKRRRKLVAI
ncbi:protein-methionine-sulfoxide reductase heme-binding subunit MsrQ [Hoeflea sp. CAU 1731]